MQESNDESINFNALCQEFVYYRKIKREMIGSENYEAISPLLSIFGRFGRCRDHVVETEVADKLPGFM